MPSEQGDSAVVIAVPAAEPVVAGWRERYDSSAAEGMPAHITALYPFLPAAHLSAEVIAHLREICAAVPVREIRFRRTARFPGLLYLDPEPPGPLRDLTAALVARWPEAPPYGGAHAEIVPHLTVAQDAGSEVLDAIDADICGRLPLTARLTEATLFAFDGRRWQPRVRLPFTG